MPTFGLLTHTDRDLLHATAQSIEAASLPGTSDFAAACQHLAQAVTVHPDGAAALAAMATTLHRALAAETTLDRWLPELASMGLALPDAMEMAADLVRERSTQADQVAAVIGLCASLQADVSTPTTAVR